MYKWLIAPVINLQNFKKETLPNLSIFPPSRKMCTRTVLFPGVGTFTRCANSPPKLEIAGSAFVDAKIKMILGHPCH